MRKYTMRFRIFMSVIVVAALCLDFAQSQVEAGGMPNSIRYRGGKAGWVIFDHQLHSSRGACCNDCHTDYKGTGKQLFATRKQGLIGIEEHDAGTKCFACHNGKGGEEKAAPNPIYGSLDAFSDCRCCHFPDSAQAKL